MSGFADSMVQDELDAVVSELCAIFPDMSRGEVHTVVVDVYAKLAAEATVSSHLIPLTLHRSRDILDSATGKAHGTEVTPPLEGDATTRDRPSGATE